MKTAHTPTPWVLEQIEPNSIYISPDHLAFDNRRSRPVCQVVIGWEGDSGRIDDTENEANAAFIIKAVNAHEKLVETLIKSRAEIRKAVELIKYLPAYTGGTTSSEDFAVMHMIDSLNMINKTLGDLGISSQTEKALARGVA